MGQLLVGSLSVSQSSGLSACGRLVCKHNHANATRTQYTTPPAKHDAIVSMTMLLGSVFTPNAASSRCSDITTDAPPLLPANCLHFDIQVYRICSNKMGALMSSSVRCQECSKLMAFVPALAGKILCPECKQRFRMMSPEAAVPKVTPVVQQSPSPGPRIHIRPAHAVHVAGRHIRF